MPSRRKLGSAMRRTAVRRVGLGLLCNIHQNSGNDVDASTRNNADRAAQRPASAAAASRRTYQEYLNMTCVSRMNPPCDTIVPNAELPCVVFI